MARRRKKGFFQQMREAQEKREKDQRRREREQRRRAKEREKLERQRRRHQALLEKERAALALLNEQERARAEVQSFDRYLTVLQKLHTRVRTDYPNWQEIRDIAPPVEPTRGSHREDKAKRKLEKFDVKPGLLTRIMKSQESTRLKLVGKIDKAKEKDEAEYQRNMERFRNAHADWKGTHDFAHAVLEGYPWAMIEAVKEENFLDEVRRLGSSLVYRAISPENFAVTMRVNAEEVIPKQAKTLNAKSLLMVKDMPKGQFYEICQDYVCSCVLRVAREIFALLPSLDTVLVSAATPMLNRKTGHMEDETILSVLIPRDGLNRLNFEHIDPSDSMENFEHNMKFLKTKGMKPVEPMPFPEPDEDSVSDEGEADPDGEFEMKLLNYCTQCGHYLGGRKGMRFCTGCGVELPACEEEDDDDWEEEEEEYEEYDEDEEEEEEDEEE